MLCVSVLRVTFFGQSSEVKIAMATDKWYTEQITRRCRTCGWQGERRHRRCPCCAEREATHPAGLSWPPGLQRTPRRNEWFDHLAKLEPRLDIAMIAQRLDKPYFTVWTWAQTFGYRYADNRRRESKQNTSGRPSTIERRDGAGSRRPGGTPLQPLRKKQRSRRAERKREVTFPRGYTADSTTRE